MADGRNVALDYARLFAIFGIIVFHAHAPGASLGYTGLPFFLLLVTLFAIPTARRHSVAGFARARAWRLIVPWLIWSAIYGSLKTLDALLDERQIASEFEPWMLLTGPAEHLWFLPFAFVVGLALHALARSASRLVLMGTGLSIAVLGLWVLQGGPSEPPLAAWAFALPATGLGFFLSAEPRGWPVVLMLVLAAWLAGWTGGLFHLSVALAALWACLHAMPGRLRAPKGVADVVMTIYLAHPLVASIQGRVSTIPTDSIWATLLTMAISFMMAVAVETFVRSPLNFWSQRQLGSLRRS